VTDIFSTFEKASFGGIEFPYMTLAIKRSLRHHVHEFLHRPGGEVESLGRRAYEFHFTCHFGTTDPNWPDLYPSRLAALVTLFETEETQDLYLPNLGGKVPAKLTECPSTLNASVRSGEAVEFTFVEDSKEKYSVLNLIGIVAGSIPAQFQTVKIEARKLADPEVLDLLDLLEAELSKWLSAKELLQNAVRYQVAQVDAVFQRCTDLMRAPAIGLPSSISLFLSASALWANLATMKNADLESSKPLSAYLTERDQMSVIDVSIRLFGTPSKSIQLLSMNAFDNPMAIKPGTTVRYLAA
jgi:hypothetical protein